MGRKAYLHARRHVPVGLDRTYGDGKAFVTLLGHKDTNRDISFGQFQESLQDYREAIELNPGDARVYEKRGHVYRGLGEYQQAIEDYDKVIALAPSNEWPYH